jgi:hypothetical protein
VRSEIAKNRILFAYLNGNDWFFYGNEDSRTLFQTDVICIIFPLLDLRTPSQRNDLFVQSSRARRASVTQWELVILRNVPRRKLGLGFEGFSHPLFGIFLSSQCKKEIRVRVWGVFSSTFWHFFMLPVQEGN